ncbi:hypothetical protein T439DRAFT_324343 [Meredithblackwellia eburnea MCA 4105]
MNFISGLLFSSGKKKPSATLESDESPSVAAAASNHQTNDLNSSPSARQSASQRSRRDPSPSLALEDDLNDASKVSSMPHESSGDSYRPEETEEDESDDLSLMLANSQEESDGAGVAARTRGRRSMGNQYKPRPDKGKGRARHSDSYVKSEGQSQEESYRTSDDEQENSDVDDGATIGVKALEREVRREEGKSRSTSSSGSKLEDSELEDDQEDEESDSLDREIPEVTKVTLNKLTMEGSHTDLPTCSLEIPNKGAVKLKRGTFIRLSGGTKASPWLSRVRSIRSLVGHNPGKSGRTYSQDVYLETAWLYDLKQLKSLPPDWRIKNSIPYLGANELVLTDSVDWNHQYAVEDIQELIFHFDDEWPANVPFAELVSSHPLSTDKKSSSLPYFFFGDDTLKPPFFDDAFRHARYYRSEFSFDLPKGKSPDDKGVKGQEKYKLKLNVHSTSQTPYKPTDVQVFSPHWQTWYHVDEVKTGKPVAEEEETQEDIFDEDGYLRSHGLSKRRASHRESERAPKRAKFEGRVGRSGTEEDDLLEKITDLSKNSVVRGGAFGLVGNSKIVLTARAFVAAGNLQSKEAEKQARRLLDAHEKFQVAVKEREKKGRKTASPGPRKVWLCPKTGKVI